MRSNFPVRRRSNAEHPQRRQPPALPLSDTLMSNTKRPGRVSQSIKKTNQFSNSIHISADNRTDCYLCLAPIVTKQSRTIEPMVTKVEFSKRLNMALDAFGVPPKGKGRQTQTAKIFGVGQKGARKWLEGEGFPSSEKMAEIASRLGVRLDWLASGRGEMYSAEFKSDHPYTMGMILAETNDNAVAEEHPDYYPLLAELRRLDTMIRKGEIPAKSLKSILDIIENSKTNH